jgi:hypothetical protein
VHLLQGVTLNSEGRNISLNSLIRTIKIQESDLIVDVAKEASVRLVDNAVDGGAAGSDVLQASGLDGTVLDEYGVGEHVEEGVCDADRGHGADGVAAADVIGELDGEEGCWRCGAGVGQSGAGEGEGGCDN